MTTLVIVGAQWGDEGKGKVVDVVAAEADVVARFAGGNNAGHTLVLGGQRIVTNLVPSGCRYPGKRCVLGAGMVLDPDVLEREVAALRAHGCLQQDELRVSGHAHVIFGFHRDLDGLREDRAQATERHIGTTRRGIGPAYEAKAARRGIRVRDLFDRDLLRERLELTVSALQPELEGLGAPPVDIAAEVERGLGWSKWLEPWVCDSGALCQAAIDAGQRVLFEGAQGTMLDLDHGTYPFVTSSSAIAGGACTGIGIGPTAIDDVWGITKAYTTRVGSGPFPTRLEGEAAERLRQAGQEFGAVTGRPRDCGWLDLPALRYAARINGMTGLCITKLDVLASLPEVWICTGYEDGVDPGSDDLARAVPRLVKVPGWGDPAVRDQLARARTLEAMPPPVRAFLDLVAETTGVPIVLISTGPERDQTIALRRAFDA